MTQERQRKNKLLTIEILIDESLDRTAEQRENFLKGYISSIPGCTVVNTNVEKADGGSDGDSIEEIRQNALANFGSQNRAVTAKDYQIRALSMPTKFGAITKAYATADGPLDNNSPSSILASPNASKEFTDLVKIF